MSAAFSHTTFLLQPDGALSLIMYNGWPIHGPGNTQIFTRAQLHGLQKHLQRYVRCGKEPTILEKVIKTTRDLVSKVTSIEDSASPDGNALPLCATWFLTSSAGLALRLCAT
jgi:hypothetical protein